MMKRVKISVIAICFLAFIGAIPLIINSARSVYFLWNFFHTEITEYGEFSILFMDIFSIFFCLLMICLIVLVLVYMFKGDKEVQYTYQEHKERISKNIADRRLARQEKKLAALEEKQKSIQDELDRMK